MTDPAPEYTEEQPLTAWRSWILYGDPPKITSLFWAGRDRYWHAGHARTATCILVDPRPLTHAFARQHEEVSRIRWIGSSVAPHDAPARYCSCGIRAFPDLPDLIADIRDNAEDLQQTWHGAGPDVWDFRCATNSHSLPDVIGRVDLWGRMYHAEADEPGQPTRAERARLGDRIYLGWQAGRAADDLRRRYPGIEVIVSDTPGPEWLDEVAAAEATTP
jgi:hypothetical protein